ncbi:MAG TPA: fasciclin domain-containing protein [Candidatus Elarobacter sp.]|jgi:uncharacterized surface protein with fasciclin (FAS1) repeats
MRLTRAAACRTLAACLAVLSLASPALAQRPATVLDVAAQQKNLSTFVGAVHTAGLDDVFRAAGPITVYAPTDAAFARLSTAERDALLGNHDRLRAMLLGSVVKDAITMGDPENVISSGSVTTVSGRDLTFGIDDRSHTTIGGAHLVAWDMRADNGSVNAIDKVLLP